jgi:hypothetical protein
MIRGDRGGEGSAMKKMAEARFLVCTLLVCAARAALVGTACLPLLGQAVAAQPNDWAEYGATRDYYNRPGRLEWRNYMGDWRDRNGAAQGNQPYAATTLVDDDRAEFIEWDVTALVQEWVDGTFQNQGFFLRAVGGSGTFNFRSREHATQGERPELAVTTATGTTTLAPEADTYLDTSTYRNLGTEDKLVVDAGGGRNALLRFDVSGLGPGATIAEAKLRLFVFAEYGSSTMDAGVFRSSQGHDLPPSDPVPGLAGPFDQDQGIANHPDVVLATGFESPAWADEWSFVSGNTDTVDSDPARGFLPLQGRALRCRFQTGQNLAASLGYRFTDKIGHDPEEIYFRYYLRLGDDWLQDVDGGKMPGISGTYGRAGWGGRQADGYNGWSARGSYQETIPADNPLGGLHPIGNYVYHADQPGQYGDIFVWKRDYRGFLTNNRWYCVEQHVKMNTPGPPGLTDGVLRAWVDGRLAFEKTDFRFRHVAEVGGVPFNIEQIWVNIYHGGTATPGHEQHVYLDSVVVARSYIGPLGPVGGPPTRRDLDARVRDRRNGAGGVDDTAVNLDIKKYREQ